MIAEVTLALQALEVDGELTPHHVLDAARDPESVLHSYFDWDDASASEKFRVDQARRLIQSYQIEFIGPDQVTKAVRGYVSVVSPSGSHAYRRTEVALSDEQMREQVLMRLRLELGSLRKRYGYLQEFAQMLIEEATLEVKKVS